MNDLHQHLNGHHPTSQLDHHMNSNNNNNNNNQNGGNNIPSLLGGGGYGWNDMYDNGMGSLLDVPTTPGNILNGLTSSSTSPSSLFRSTSSGINQHNNQSNHNNHHNNHNNNHNNQNNNNNSQQQIINNNIEIIKSKIIATNSLIQKYRTLQQQHKQCMAELSKYKGLNNSNNSSPPLIGNSTTSPILLSASLNGTTTAQPDYQKLYLREKREAENLKQQLDDEIKNNQSPMLQKIAEAERRTQEVLKVILEKDAEIISLTMANRQHHAKAQEEKKESTQSVKEKELKRENTNFKKEIDKLKNQISALKSKQVVSNSNNQINNNNNQNNRSFKSNQETIAWEDREIIGENYNNEGSKYQNDNNNDEEKDDEDDGDYDVEEYHADGNLSMDSNQSSSSPLNVSTTLDALESMVDDSMSLIEKEEAGLTKKELDKIKRERAKLEKEKEKEAEKERKRLEREEKKKEKEALKKEKEELKRIEKEREREQKEREQKEREKEEREKEQQLILEQQQEKEKEERIRQEKQKELDLEKEVVRQRVIDKKKKEDKEKELEKQRAQKEKPKITQVAPPTFVNPPVVISTITPPPSISLDLNDEEDEEMEEVITTINNNDNNNNNEDENLLEQEIFGGDNEYIGYSYHEDTNNNVNNDNVNTTTTTVTPPDIIVNNINDDEEQPTINNFVQHLQVSNNDHDDDRIKSLFSITQTPIASPISPGIIFSDKHHLPPSQDNEITTNTLTKSIDNQLTIISTKSPDTNDKSIDIQDIDMIIAVDEHSTTTNDDKVEKMQIDPNDNNKNEEVPNNVNNNQDNQNNNNNDQQSITNNEPVNPIEPQVVEDVVKSIVIEPATISSAPISLAPSSPITKVIEEAPRSKSSPVKPSLKRSKAESDDIPPQSIVADAPKEVNAVVEEPKTKTKRQRVQPVKTSITATRGSRARADLPELAIKETGPVESTPLSIPDSSTPQTPSAPTPSMVATETSLSTAPTTKTITTPLVEEAIIKPIKYTPTPIPILTKKTTVPPKPITPIVTLPTKIIEPPQPQPTTPSKPIPSPSKKITKASPKSKATIVPPTPVVATPIEVELPQIQPTTPSKPTPSTFEAFAPLPALSTKTIEQKLDIFINSQLDQLIQGKSSSLSIYSNIISKINNIQDQVQPLHIIIVTIVSYLGDLYKNQKHDKTFKFPNQSYPIISLIHQFKNQDNFLNEFKRYLNGIIVSVSSTFKQSTDDINILKLSIYYCEIFSLVCKVGNDISPVLTLMYDLMQHFSITTLEYFERIIYRLPNLFKSFNSNVGAGGIGNLLLETIKSILYSKLSQFKIDNNLKKIITNNTQFKDINLLKNELVSKLQINASHVDGGDTVYIVLKCMELLIINHYGFLWGYDDFIRTRLWPILASQTTSTIKCHVIQSIGQICLICNPQKSDCVAIKNALTSILSQQSQYPYDLQRSASVAYLQLSSELSDLEYVKSWFKRLEQIEKDQCSTFLKQFIQV